MVTTKKLIFNIIIGICWVTIIVLISKIIYPYLAIFIFPDLDKVILPIDSYNIFFLIMAIFFMGLIGMSIRMIEEKSFVISFFPASRLEKITYIIISYLLSNFIHSIFLILEKFRFISFPLIFIVFLFYLPNFIEFMTYSLFRFIFFLNIISPISDDTFKNRYQLTKSQKFHMSSFNLQNTFEDIKNRDKKIYKKFAVVILIIGIISFLVFAIVRQTETKIAQEHRRLVRLSYNPVINSIQPYIVYYGNKIISKGKGFGWRSNENQKLKTQFEDLVFIDSWTDSRIIITVPLHWPIGIIKIWIEKTIKWNGKNEIAKSNIFPIKLIPVSSAWSKDDDEYFKALSTLDNDVLLLNGYEPKQ